MRIFKALLLPFLLIVSLIGVDRPHAPRSAVLMPSALAR
jgi:hypothetical protein